MQKHKGTLTRSLTHQHTQLDRLALSEICWSATAESKKQKKGEKKGDEEGHGIAVGRQFAFRAVKCQLDDSHDEKLRVKFCEKLGEP